MDHAVHDDTMASAAPPDWSARFAGLTVTDVCELLASLNQVMFC